MKTDIAIAQEASLAPIGAIAEKLGIQPEELIPYGQYKAKLSPSLQKRLDNQQKALGRLILVTAINPTPMGEGKTTTTVGLGEALGRLHKRSAIALREPSLGPVFGVKGGAAGGGYAQVVPMEDINLHFTGDIHAVTAANNLLCALIDNHLQQGNALGLDPRRIAFKRAMDMNDRALRHIVVGMGGTVNGVVREDAFQISVASEVMAVLCLAQDIEDLKNRLGNMLVGWTTSNTPVYVRDLQAQGAMAALLRDALQPNLVQTLENTPAFMHGGPFANIAHGCNSLSATKLALSLCDYVVTEAGFGSDLGAEKFFHIKCRAGGLTPAAVVLVATLRALKYNGGIPKEDVAKPNKEALRKGLCNLQAHMENLQKFGVPVVVAINRFPQDEEKEIALLADFCAKGGCRFALSEVFVKGGEGGLALAEQVLEACQEPSNFHFLYDVEDTIENKIRIISREIYGAKNVTILPGAQKTMRQLEALGHHKLPICMAKTQYSLSDNPSLLGRPSNFTITVREIRLSAGAGFLVALTGDVMTMPGLPKHPAALDIDVTSDGRISGLF